MTSRRVKVRSAQQDCHRGGARRIVDQIVDLVLVAHTEHIDLLYGPSLDGEDFVWIDE